MTDATEVSRVAQIANLRACFERKHASQNLAPMDRVSLVLLVIFIAAAGASGQSVARLSESANSEIEQQRALANHAVAALRRLDSDVFIYRSLGDFEAGSKLAQVSFETFRSDLDEVTSEVEPILSQLPADKLKTEIMNALDSYRDGAIWWR